jgi:DNA integrity scanning protein DisA with diadenylate cyclase activity
MSHLAIVQLIGNILTKLDMLLASPDLPQSSPDWQQLYALRKHLDDQQRELVKDIFDEDTAQFSQLTQQLQSANDQLQQLPNDIKTIATIIGYVSKAASVVDQLLNAAM